METAKAFLIKPDNTTKDIQPGTGKKFTIQELYKLIETDTIEVLHLPTGDLLIVDEEGKPMGKPHNALATSYYLKDNIVGNAVICKRNMFS